MDPEKWKVSPILSTPCLLGRLNSMQNIESMSQTSSCILNLEPEDFDGIDNIVELPCRGLDKVIACIRKRFLQKEFYTWAGQTLLSLHPYETGKNFKCNPSMDDIISRAWFRLEHRVGEVHQHVVISGESGAGKTHSACLALKRVAEIVGESNLALYEIWSSVPLLSAFGNAKTVCNCNSSRFGKLMELHCVNGNISGADVQIYMLEKSRVTGPGVGEGNFHIFRQILDDLDEDALRMLCLSKQVQYRIAPCCDVKSTYKETLAALEVLGIYDLEDILVVLAIILNLGNVSFETVGDIFTVSTDSLEFVENVGRLLLIKPKDFINLICTRRFSPKTRRQTIYQSACMNREECEERRDCIMKLLYDRLFTWLVHAINCKLGGSDGTHQSLSFLDIYGFEVFDHNGFEQLCINYANERLQQFYVDNYLLEKRTSLLQEGFDVEQMDTADYTKRLALIHGPISIFGILNEECAVKRFNNDLFVNTRLTETLRSKTHFIGSLNDLNTTFSIKHYAGVVKYDTRMMLGKNRDHVPEDIINFLRGCERFEFMVQLVTFAPLSNGKTLITNFKKSLDNLVDTLNAGDVHYVKCLKPNPYNLAEFFDEDFFEQQLAANGICEVFKLNFQQFSLRFHFEEFIKKFSVKLFNILKDVLDKNMHLGRKFIYLTEAGYLMFETMHRIQLSMLARRIQIAWRRFHWQRKRFLATIDENVIELSRKSSEMSVLDARAFKGEQCECIATEESKLPMVLEGGCNEIEVKPFKRVLFFGDRVVSFSRVAKIPVRFHVAKTCIKYSNLLPKSELPTGLLDIF